MHRAWQGKDIRLCTKSYSSQEVEAMQLLDTKLAEVTNAQKKQRLVDQSDPLLNTHTSLSAHTVSFTAKLVRGSAMPVLTSW